MDQYAMYLRKSRTDEEAEKYGELETLKKHEEILTALAEKQGLYIAKKYKEIVSGQTIEARPEIQKLIADCYNGEYKGILVVDIDRLSRGNQGDMQTIMDCLRYSNNREGLLVITPTKTYDICKNADDEEYMEFVLFMSRREYKMIRKRLERGKTQALIEGQFMATRRPYGYEITQDKRVRTLTPVPGEAEVVEAMFKMRAYEKLSYYQIAKKLTSEGFLTYYGGKTWAPETVISILKNPVYLGKIRWNYRMKIKMNGKIIRPVSVDNSQYMVIDGLHPAIITQKLWDDAQATMSAPKVRNNRTLVNPLSGLLLCVSCNTSLHLSSQRRACKRIYHKYPNDCNFKSASFDSIMSALAEGLKAYLDDFEIMIKENIETDAKALERRIEALDKEEASINRKLEKIFDDYEEGIYTSAEFIKRKSLHNGRLEEINDMRNNLMLELDKKPAPPKDIVSSLHQAISLIESPETDPEAINKFLKSFIKCIYYSHTKEEGLVLDITFK